MEFLHRLHNILKYSLTSIIKNIKPTHIFTCVAASVIILLIHLRKKSKQKFIEKWKKQIEKFNTNDNTTTQQLVTTIGQIEEASSLLGRAFYHDPVMKYFVPDPEVRRNWLQISWRSFIKI